MSGSALPKAVQKQIETANNILEEINKTPEDPENPNPEPKEPEKEPAKEPAKEPEKEPAKEPEKQQEPAPEPAKEPAKEPDKEGWEHKYNVLQGKYNAEVPRLQRQLQESNDVVAEMRQRLNNQESVLASLQAQAKAPAKPAEPEKPAISKEEEETYGPDLVDLIRRAAQEEAKKLVAAGVKPVADKIDKVNESASQVSQTVAQSRKDQTNAALDEGVPEWRDLNGNEDFLKWLDQVDPYSGQVRGILLRTAYQAFDANRCIAIFRGYLQENAAVTPEPSSDAPSEPEAEPKEPQTKMEDLVAPGQPKSPTAGAPNEAGKRVWTQKEVSNLYAKKNEFIRRNPGKDIPEELQKLERDLFKAQKEGRLR